MTTDTMNISIRMDRELKKEADELFGEMGMNISTAFNIFVRQALRERAFPFSIKLDEKPSVTREQALKAFHELRAEAADMPEMSLDEINAEIAAARAERKRKAGSA